MSYDDITLEDASINDLIEELEHAELNADHRQRLRELGEGETKWYMDKESFEHRKEMEGE